MNTLTIIILTIIGTSGLLALGKVIYSTKQGSQIPWNKITLIIANLFVQVQKIQEADKLGYDALEQYSVRYIKEQIDNASFLSIEEKQIFTEDLIRSFIRPELLKLYAH